MTWWLLAVAVLLAWLGIDMIRLSTRGQSETRAQETEQILGKGHPPLSDSARNFLASRFLVRSGPSTLIAGCLFVVLSLVTFLIAAGWLDA